MRRAIGEANRAPALSRTAGSAQRKRSRTRRIGSAPLNVRPRRSAAVLGGLALPQYRAVEDSWSIAHPRWLIPPPSGGSSGYFTSPSRGRAKWPTWRDSESQEDRGGPQPTSSERRPRSFSLRPLRVTLRSMGRRAFVGALAALAVLWAP